MGAVNPTYDTNGNLTSDGTFTFTYDSANRLITASATGVAASYAYDSRGQRKSKTVNGTTTYYISDENDREVLGLIFGRAGHGRTLGTARAISCATTRTATASTKRSTRLSCRATARP